MKYGNVIRITFKQLVLNTSLKGTQMLRIPFTGANYSRIGSCKQIAIVRQKITRSLIIDVHELLEHTQAGGRS